MENEADGQEREIEKLREELALAKFKEGAFNEFSESSESKNMEEWKQKHQIRAK